MKYLEYPRLMGIKIHGWGEVPSCINMLSSYRQQKSTSFLRFGALSRRQNYRISTICTVLDKQNWEAYTIFYLSWAGLEKRRTSRARVGDFPTAHRAEVTPGSPNDDGGDSNSAWKVRRSNHLHVDVQRHWLGESRETMKLECRILQMLLRTREDFPKDIGHSSDQELKKSGTERTFQTKRFEEPCCRADGDQSQRKRASSIQRNKCVVPRSFEKQRRSEIIDTLQRRSSDSRVVISVSTEQ